VSIDVSQEARDLVEVVNGFVTLKRQWTDRCLEAVIQMVKGKRSFGLPDGLFDRIKLMNHFKAWPAGLDHFDDFTDMSLRALEALDGIRMGGMKVWGVDHA